MKNDLIQKDLSNYKLVIENFEGPLDLLVYLISKNKMDIFDISLSSLTDKYIEYLNTMSEMNLEITSEFIVMASTLLNIKSKKLLPQLSEDSDEDEIDEKDIISRIVEYKKYKEISEKIYQLYRNNFGSFEKDPEKIKFKRNIDTTELNIDADKLYKVYFDMLERNQNKINIKANDIRKLALYEKITVKDKVKQIVSYLDKNDSMIFNNVYNIDSCSNIEIVTAFLGVLELSKLRQVNVNQACLFSDIKIIKNNLIV